MRFIYCANGVIGATILHWLVQTGDRPAGIVIHPPERARLRDEMIETAGLDHANILDGSIINTEEGLAWLGDRQPDLLLSVNFGYLFGAAVLSVPSKGAINLHTSLLPFNRGAYPNVWTIVDGTPAGVTLHRIDERIDNGEIIAQCEIPSRAVDTGATLYARLEQAAIELFKAAWPSIRAGSFEPRPQVAGGSFHTASELRTVERIDPNQQLRAGQLIDILRACTFPPHKGAYLDLGNRRIYLRLELSEELV